MSFTFEPTQDRELIKSIMTHPRIYPALIGDFCVPPESFEPPMNPLIWKIIVREFGALRGMFIFAPQNRICWEIHTCLLPEAWGFKSRRIARELVDWFWRNSSCLRVFTCVIRSNRAALAFAKAAGLDEFGVNPRSFMKDGQLQDQVMLGISRPEGAKVKCLSIEEED